MDQRNLLLAIALSMAILFGFQYLMGPPPPPPGDQATEEAQVDGAGPPQPATSSSAVPGAPPVETRADALAKAPRLDIRSPRMHGSISLAGGRLDDVSLPDYRVTVDPDSPEITVLSPAGTPTAYYAEFGWVPATPGTPVPDSNTVWETQSTQLTPSAPVVLSWDNGAGLRFTRTYALDQNFMVTVTQSVENNSGEPVTLFPYGLISRTGTPETSGFFILHEGPVAVLNGTLREIDYDELQDDGKVEAETTGGWLGITDKYWLVSLVPDQAAPVKARFMHTLAGQSDKYQADYLGEALTVAPGAASDVTNRLFAGAKETHLLDSYRDELGITRFDLAVDWGWFYFLTKPIFYALHWLKLQTGNFGVAILLLTVAIKLVFFPLANKSYRAMSKMKALQPEMMKLRERYADDKQRLNQELMALYRNQKVNPAAGCLPILVQIPVFFALYKVLFVSIEMRHAPFFGWIRDLSAPDPTNIFELFGLLPWDAPEFLHFGAWPLIMGLTMFLQMKLNPQPADPVQAKVFMFMPLIFTVLLAGFPAGLVIYWAWNNTLSIAQQWVIMRRAEAEERKSLAKSASK